MKNIKTVAMVCAMLLLSLTLCVACSHKPKDRLEPVAPAATDVSKEPAPASAATASQALPSLAPSVSPWQENADDSEAGGEPSPAAQPPNEAEGNRTKANTPALPKASPTPKTTATPKPTEQTSTPKPTATPAPVITPTQAVMPTPSPSSAPTPEPTPIPTPVPVPVTVPPTAPVERRTICNICGADITGNVPAHGDSHLLNGEDFSYRVE